MIGFVLNVIQHREHSNGFLVLLLYMLFYTVDRGIGRVAVLHHEAVHKLGHGINNVADLVFFILGGNDDGDCFIFKHEM